MQGKVFESDGDEPLYVIEMGGGFGMISQANERGKVESIGADAQRLRAMADYLDALSKNTDQGNRKQAA